ncbi:Holliday junction resolvase RuvX [Candidatus Margulisiibacteriota bacterium]
MSNRLIGLDYGKKRIGIALSDPLNITAQAHSYLENNANTLPSLKKLADEYDIDTIIIGLPKNQFGQDSPMAEEVRIFAKKLENELGLNIEFWDERYSSAAVTKHLIAANVSRKKRKKIIDSSAAAFILQGYLDNISLKNN